MTDGIGQGTAKPLCSHKHRYSVFSLDEAVVLRVGAAFEHSQSASKAPDTAAAAAAPSAGVGVAFEHSQSAPRASDAAAAAAPSAGVDQQGGARGLLLLVPLMLGLNGKVPPGSPQRGPVSKRCTFMTARNTWPPYPQPVYVHGQRRVTKIVQASPGFVPPSVKITKGAPTTISKISV